MKLIYDAKSTMVAQGWRKGGATVAQRHFTTATTELLSCCAMAQDGARWRKLFIYDLIHISETKYDIPTPSNACSSSRSCIQAACYNFI